MYLKRLELSGFKSFAKKSELTFTTPITAIVGPNGSGKSNVAEAFRFVLGEQSIKSLRGKRGEDLIFGGSKTVGRLNRAGVKVTFDNTERVFNVDFDEVTIERVVHRDSTNEYLVNGSNVRLRDVLELLAQAHIGASGHHIISQGEADRILNATSKERKAMVEDALGLKVYQYKRQESERKLEKTNENIASVESLRREIAPHIRFLKKQVEKIERAFELKNELALFYKEYFKREELYLAHEKDVLAEARKAPTDELALLSDRLAKAKEELAQGTEADTLNQELTKIDDEMRGLRHEKDEISRSLGRLEGMISFESRRIEREKTLEQEVGGKAVPYDDVVSLTTTLEKYITEISVATDLSVAQRAGETLRGALSDFSNRIQALIPKRAPVSRDELDRMEEEQTALAAKRDTLLKQEETLQQRYATLKAEVEAKKIGSREAEKTVFEIMARQNELRSVLYSFKNREELLARAEEDYKRELTESAALIGREAFNISHFEILDSFGTPLGNAALLAEARQTQEDRRRTLEKMKIRLEDLGAGGGSDDTLKEYQDLIERETFLSREIEDLQKSAESLRLLIADLQLQLETEFKTGLAKINAEFGNFFTLMFGGGSASIALVREKKRKRESEEMLLDDMSANLMNSLSKISEGVGGDAAGAGESDAPEEGLEIDVALPLKKTKGLMMLSGGERALTSIALLFAISQVNPPPFIILDETDAALDEANSRKYGDMIESLARYSQLILITHNRETMSRAGVLYGVTMGGDGVSRLLSIELTEAVAVAK